MGARFSACVGALVCLLASLCACRSSRGALPQTPGVDWSLEGVALIDLQDARQAAAAELAQYERRSSKRAVCDDAAYALERLYKSRGFAAAKVQWELDEGAAGPPARPPRVVLRVQEGPLTRIAKVSIEGAKVMSRSDILDRLSTRFDANVAEGRAIFVEELCRQALDDLIEDYRQLGCLDADIDYLVRDLGEGGAAVALELSVREGTRFLLRKLRLVGSGQDASAALPGPANDLDFEDVTNQALSPTLLRRIRARILEAYDSAGYPDVEVQDGVLTPLDPSDPGAIELVMAVSPGELVHIGAIELRGNRRTQSGRVLSALEFEPGDRWDVRKERLSFRELSRAGLFSRVHLRLEPSQGATRNLVVDLEEAPSREFYLEPGFGSYERARLGIGWSERNLFGTARVLDAKGSLSEFAQSASLSLTDRRFLDLPLQASATVFANRREEPSFETQNVGTGVALTRRLSSTLEMGLAYQFRRSDVFGSDLTDPGIQDLLDDVDVSSMALTGVHDTRDDAFGPSDGSLVRAAVEYGDKFLGSELDFTRLRLVLARFTALSERLVLGLSWRGGTIAPHGSTVNIPLQERFFNGGENTVRSFKESALGLTDSNGEPLGGEGYQVASVELRRRVGPRLELAAFYDGGNLVQEAGNLFDFDGLRHAVGVGLRYHLPVGPVRVDWGINPDPQRDESSSIVHVSIGMSF